jgi:RimJ/RimL family protein N-acetyltransferase
MNVQLRDVIADDLPIFYEQQRDPAAVHMAAYVAARDPAAHAAHWAKILRNETGIAKTILFENQVAGFLVKFIMFDEPEVGYWIGKDYWGKGITTQALAQFLLHLTMRPLYAHAAKDNLASLRVLQKCGFEVIGYDRSFADGRGEEIEGVALRLSM